MRPAESVPSPGNGLGGSHQRTGLDLVIDRNPHDDVETRCWCDRTFQWVTLREAQAGITKSCGRPKCHPPEGSK